jgi:hypothetical protein
MHLPYGNPFLLRCESQVLVASFRCDAEFGWLSGIADLTSRPPGRFMGSQPSLLMEQMIAAKISYHLSLSFCSSHHRHRDCLQRSEYINAASVSSRSAPVETPQRKQDLTSLPLERGLVAA